MAEIDTNTISGETVAVIESAGDGEATGIAIGLGAIETVADNVGAGVVIGVETTPGVTLSSPPPSEALNTKSAAARPVFVSVWAPLIVAVLSFVPDAVSPPYQSVMIWRPFAIVSPWLTVLARLFVHVAVQLPTTLGRFIYTMPIFSKLPAGTDTVVPVDWLNPPVVAPLSADTESSNVHVAVPLPWLNSWADAILAFADPSSTVMAVGSEAPAILVHTTTDRRYVEFPCSMVLASLTVQPDPEIVKLAALVPLRSIAATTNKFPSVGVAPNVAVAGSACDDAADWIREKVMAIIGP